MDTFVMLDPRMPEWQALPPLPEARAAHASVAVDGLVSATRGPLGGICSNALVP
jgi:hypothetical protein